MVVVMMMMVMVVVVDIGARRAPPPPAIMMMMVVVVVVVVGVEKLRHFHIPVFALPRTLGFHLVVSSQERQRIRDGLQQIRV